MTPGSALPRAGRGLLLGLAGDALVTAAIFGMTRAFPVREGLAGLYVLPVLPIAAGWGLWPALATAVGGALVFDFFFWPPLLSFAVTDLQIAWLLVMPGAVAVVVSRLAERARRRTGEAQALAGEVQRTAEEQAALRRVATLVARGAPPEEVFVAVTAEVGQVLSVDLMNLGQFDPDGEITIVGGWARSGTAVPRGARIRLGGENVATRVFQTRRSARMDDYAHTATGPVADVHRGLGIRAAVVGAPISVEGRLWGVMVVLSAEAQLPADTELRLAGFTDLVATAIANAQARVELRAFGQEEAALRRVATLVAGAAPPEKVFAAVTEEVGRLLGADFASLGRFEVNDTVSSAGYWSATGEGQAPVRIRLGGQNATSLVFRTGRPARLDDYAVASGEAGAVARGWGASSSVGVPITVEDRPWGVVVVSASRAEPFPADAEDRLAGFAELVATAVANAQARTELRGFAEEQAALRRVATLVAEAAPAERVLAAVTEEVGRLLDVDRVSLSRYVEDRGVWLASGWWRPGAEGTTPTADRAKLGGRNVSTLVFETGRPARIDDYADASGASADAARRQGLQASVGVPIGVEGRLWGVISTTSRTGPLPAGTEARLAGFTELVATAIANADARAALDASRARVVAAGDETRRRLERDLHDGIQQGLVALILQAAAAGELRDDQVDQMRAELVELRRGLVEALDELRETARGIHPSILTEAGLGAALSSLARRCALPVDLEFHAEGRLPEPIEAAAYYVVAEAMTNAVKHAEASEIEVAVALHERALHVRVRDDGHGGARLGGGSGLVGLTDRVEALGGGLTVDSPPAVGTTLEVWLPLVRANGQAPPTPHGAGNAGRVRTESR